jgi:hypothetical protein
MKDMRRYGAPLPLLGVKTRSAVLRGVKTRSALLRERTWKRRPEGSGGKSAREIEETWLQRFGCLTIGSGQRRTAIRTRSGTLRRAEGFAPQKRRAGAGTGGTLFPGNEPTHMALCQIPDSEAAMSAGDAYRAKAAEIADKAKAERDPAVRAELEALRRNYLRLAVQADKNSKTDIVYETPRRHGPTEPQQPAQQQQQRQPKKKDPET